LFPADQETRLSTNAVQSVITERALNSCFQREQSFFTCFPVALLQ
jgi:hypothetical protein